MAAWAVLLGCLLALTLVALPASSAIAGEREADPLTTGPIPPQPGAGPVPDRVLEGRPRALLGASAASDFSVYPDGDGHFVNVRVSSGYSNPEGAAQDLVDFLGGLLHGDEMNRLSVFLATPSEIRHECGAAALACYYPSGDQMVVSGEDSGPGQPPRELVITHEYGHHVAENRNNAPWSALDRGTKRWSSYEGICRRIERRTIRPSRYFQNPGEAFAEAFAFYHYPDVYKWEWRIARPDAGAFAAIYDDVTLPWSGRTPTEWSGSLDGTVRRQATRLGTPLDGRLKVTLDGPAGAEFDLLVVAGNGGRVLKRATAIGADETLFYTLCGRRAVRIVVRGGAGAGAFEVTAARP